MSENTDEREQGGSGAGVSEPDRESAPSTATECMDCGAGWAYDRVRCHDCGGNDVRKVELGVGELVSTTVSRVTPPGVREPNPLGIADFDDVSLVAQLADEDLTAGEDVVLTGEYELRDGYVGPRLEATD